MILNRIDEAINMMITIKWNPGNGGFAVLFLMALAYSGCTDPIPPDPGEEGKDLTHIAYNPQPYQLQLPPAFPRMNIPEDNPLTIDGVRLGRFLFYDPILSIDSTISCSSCHFPAANFSDNRALSIGVDGRKTKRSSMSLLNVGLHNRGLFWDGRVMTLEEQAALPIEDPNEMNNTWEEVIKRLSNHDLYPELFRKAFGVKNSKEISKDLATKAIAQFERIMVSSGNSKFDRVERGLDIYSDVELLGRDLFFDDNQEVPDAECNHCHSLPLITANDYFNNGLDEAVKLTDFKDLGRGAITGILADNGRFRTTTLRNIRHSGPYMHDGRFQTLEEVVEFYNTGGKNAPNKDPLLRPLGLTDHQKKALIAFIETMEDVDFLNNPDLQNPF